MRYENETFDALPIDFDDSEFVGCTFNDCSFRYAARGKLHVERCTINGSLNIALGGAAEATASFLRLFAGNEAGLRAIASVLGIASAGGGVN